MSDTHPCDLGGSVPSQEVFGFRGRPMSQPEDR